jgi:hypothetical protein
MATSSFVLVLVIGAGHSPAGPPLVSRPRLDGKRSVVGPLVAGPPQAYDRPDQRLMVTLLIAHGSSCIAMRRRAAFHVDAAAAGG